MYVDVRARVCVCMCVYKCLASNADMCVSLTDTVVRNCVSHEYNIILTDTEVRTSVSCEYNISTRTVVRTSVSCEYSDILTDTVVRSSVSCEYNDILTAPVVRTSVSREYNILRRLFSYVIHAQTTLIPARWCSGFVHNIVFRLPICTVLSIPLRVGIEVIF
jgi:hypothetical protein